MYNAKVIPEKGMLSAIEAHVLIWDIARSGSIDRNNARKSEDILDQLEAIIRRFRAYQATMEDPSIDPWEHDPIGTATFDM